MSSTSSRVLRDGDLASVAPVWWQDAKAPQPISAPSAGRSRAGSSPEDTGAADAAYHRGFLEGQKTGKEQAAAEMQAVLDRLVRGLAELAGLRVQIRKEAEGELLKLSIAVARRVLHRELTLDPDSIEGLIRAGLAKLESRELSRVRIHPSQERAVRAALDRAAETRKVELVLDPMLEAGDVLFETAHGTLDASIEMQLREIDRGFADRLRR